jgi:Recombination directionality factor-like
MTIVGLTDGIVPRYPRLGKLRKGGEKSANGYGPDLDHFRFVSPYPEVAKAFHGSYPNKPNQIRLFIPHDTVEDAFSTSCEVWNKTGLVHRCDGQTMSVWREGARYVRGAKPCTGGHRDGDPHRDALGRLEFIIPQLVEKGFVGYVSLETHSLNDILNISRVLAAIYKSHGTLAGVEFVLKRVKENISVPGWGEHKNDRARVDKWLVRLEPSVEWVKSHVDVLQRQAFAPLPPAPVSLPEPNELAEHEQPGMEVPF